MECRKTETIARQPDFHEFTGFDSNRELVGQRLSELLEINAETARQKSLYRTDKEKLEAETMPHPMTLEQTFAYFGLLLGAFPPAAFFIRFAIDARIDSWVFGVMFIVNLIAAVVGYFSGKLIAKGVRRAESLSWTQMLLLVPFLGLFWGMLTGGTGGIIIFIVGAFFGAVIGGMVGGFALPVFTIFHRLLKKGETIDRRHFLPLAFGITFVICGFILGL